MFSIIWLVNEKYFLEYIFYFLLKKFKLIFYLEINPDSQVGAWPLHGNQKHGSEGSDPETNLKLDPKPDLGPHPTPIPEVEHDSHDPSNSDTRLLAKTLHLNWIQP